MPTERSPALLEFAPVETRRVVAGLGGGAIASDAGAPLLGAADRAIGPVRRFAARFQDARAPGRAEHAVATLVGQRAFGVALGHEGLDDRDRLRHDPVLAVLAGKLEAARRDCAPPAGKSALSRLEHAPSGEPGRRRRVGHEAAATEALFVDLLLGARRSPPRRIVLDLGATDVPLHGHQGPKHRFGRRRLAGSSTATATPGATSPSTSSAAGTRSRPSSAAPTSMARPAPSGRSSASPAGSAPAGRGSASCPGRIPASPAGR